MEIRAGSGLIGILYNFVYRSTVSFYQSAFVYEDDNRLKPGYVAHALAIEAALRDGFDTYDFLAADNPSGSRYKQSMSTRTGRLAWAVLRRKTIPLMVVDGLRKARARLP
jgi:CelD/BcsL family acetyltransferase involved in cellulose biosynthesis